MPDLGLTLGTACKDSLDSTDSQAGRGHKIYLGNRAEGWRGL